MTLNFEVELATWNAMFFEHPTWLLALWLVPAIGWLLAVARRRRLAKAEVFAEPVMLKRLAPRQNAIRSLWKATALLLGLSLLILGAARPRWGVYFETVHARGVDLFVLLDVSRSMLAEDVAPNRLLRAKSDIRDLLMKLVGDRVGLIVFAGAPVVKVPLTTDQAYLRTVLEEVDPDSAPRGGSLIGDAIRKAIESLGPRGDRDQVIVLITDGEDHDSYPTEAAKQAAEKGIKVFTVGLGDSGEGRRVPIRDKSGNLTYLQHDGQEVWSKMDEKLLKDIAITTGGAYVPAKTFAYDLGEIYSQHLQKLTRGELASEKRIRYGERFQVFLIAGLALLILDMLIPRFPKNNRNAGQPSDSGAVADQNSSGTSQSKKETGSARKRRPAKAMVLYFLFSLAPASIVFADAAREIRTGVRNHLAGKYEEAEKSFAAAAKEMPNHPVVLYDRACALAALGKLDEAEDLFQQSKSGDDPKITADSHYNLGCLDSTRAKNKFGENPEAATADIREEGMKLLEQAVGHYRDCLELNPNHVAARHNLEVIRVWMKHMTDVWRRRDREKARQELSLLDFLLMIEQRQDELLQTTKALTAERTSPQRRQASTAAGQTQRELAEEISTLQTKIQATLQQPNQTGASANSTQSPSANDPQMEEAINRLVERATQIRSEMSQAAADLATNELPTAANHQQHALHGLDELYRTMAPFDHVLQRSIQAEEDLLGNTRPLTDEKTSLESNALTSVQQELVSRQQQVGKWIETLGPKASILLRQLESRAQAAPDDESTDDPSTQSKPTAPKPNTEELKKYYQKGIEIAPKAHQAAKEAAELLSKNEWSPAVSKEEEVVNLLKEIASSAPKAPPEEQKPQEKEDQQKQDQQNQDSQQKKSDTGKEGNEQKKESESKQQGEPKPNQDQSKKESGADQAGKKSPPNASREMAEALLRRVRQREREHKERERELQAVIRGAVPVEKDW